MFFSPDLNGGRQADYSNDRNPDFGFDEDSVLSKSWLVFGGENCHLFNGRVLGLPGSVQSHLIQKSMCDERKVF